ncbi:hypothetical protein EVAR_101866_1 [Eumeta japonica]|uniref:Uncharacterized protein n=1 Tax=Eumeta variegata TaxID=151549 RepID=A0A4C1SMV5_EUMVA|nr:hypothetical protein EVAR_101866_1 [Eumeta japonica]
MFKSGANKIKVVFNASFPTSTGVSLNVCSHSEEKLQLNQLSNDEEAKYPVAMRLPRSSVYIDDVLGRTHTEAEAKELMLAFTK